MSEVQAIFKKVIQAGHYGPDGCSYMCNALSKAQKARTISKAQADQAEAAIREYMDELWPNRTRNTDCLVGVLHCRGYSDIAKGWFETAGTDFYLNWDNRPRRV